VGTMKGASTRLSIGRKRTEAIINYASDILKGPIGILLYESMKIHSPIIFESEWHSEKNSMGAFRRV